MVLCHCKKIGNNMLIGMNATVMAHTVIEDNIIVDTGALVLEK